MVTDRAIDSDGSDSLYCSYESSNAGMDKCADIGAPNPLSHALHDSNTSLVSNMSADNGTFTAVVNSFVDVANVTTVRPSIKSEAGSDVVVTSMGPQSQPALSYERHPARRQATEGSGEV